MQDADRELGELAPRAPIRHRQLDPEDRDILGFVYADAQGVGDQAPEPDAGLDGPAQGGLFPDHQAQGAERGVAAHLGHAQAEILEPRLSRRVFKQPDDRRGRDLHIRFVDAAARQSRRIQHGVGRKPGRPHQIDIA